MGHGMLGGHIYAKSLNLILSYYIFSIISNLLFSLNCSILNFHISLLQLRKNSFPSASHYFNTELTIRDNFTFVLKSKL